MLRDIYEQYRVRGNEQIRDLAETLYAPILVEPPANWEAAHQRIVYVGQETGDWIFSEEDAERWEYEWKKESIESLADFFKLASSVNDLMDGYKQFDCASRKDMISRSPFWRYFRQCRTTAEQFDSSVSILFTNVIRCAANLEPGRNPWNIPKSDRARFLDWQKGLLTAELQALKPTMVLFVTGPYYDEFLESELSNLKFSETGQFDVRVLAKLDSPSLPAASYRTYHPGYLNRTVGFEPLRAAIERTLLTH